MKKFICSVMAVVAAFGFVACNGNPAGGGERGIRPPEISQEEFYRIPSYEKSDYPLLGMCGLHAKYNSITQANMDGLAAAGYDIAAAAVNIFAGDNWESNKKALDMAEKAGLKLVVLDEFITVFSINGEPAVKPFSSTKFAEISNHPALYGVDIKDEPHKSEVNQYLKQRLADFKNAAFRGNPKFCVNLSFATELVGYITHEEQVNYVAENLDLPHISYDLYMLRNRSGQRLWDDSFMSYIEQSSYAAKIRHGLPVWGIKLTSGHSFPGCDFPSPTEAEMRWQTAAMMAFGTDTVWDYSFDKQDATYSALVDENGNRTEVYDRVEAVSLEVSAWKDVYHAFSPGWIGTLGLGGSHGNVNGMFRRLKYEIPVADMDAVTSIVSDEDVLVGYFKDERRNNGFMLTNGSAPTGATKDVSASATLEFETKYSGVQVFEKGVPTIYDLGKDGKLTVTLEPGEGKFLIPLVKK